MSEITKNTWGRGWTGQEEPPSCACCERPTKCWVGGKPYCTEHALEALAERRMLKLNPS